MKRTLQTIRMLVGAGILLTTAVQAQTNTYTWADNAQGQVYLECPNGSGGFSPSFWPSNSVWSQSVHTGDNCDNSGTVVSQPSNWDPAPGVGIYPGGPGALGVNVVLGPPANTELDTPVTINALTVQTNGALAIATCGGITANTIDLQGDGQIIWAPLCGGGGAYINILPGGTLAKSSGTGSYVIDPETPGGGPSLYGNDISIIVKSGTLVFPSSSAHTALADSTLAVSNNASLVLVPDINGFAVLTGVITGTGGGVVSFSTGGIEAQGSDFNGNFHSGLQLNFPGNMFQWSGGNFNSGSGVTNVGVINVTNFGPTFAGVQFVNSGILNLASNSALAVSSSPMYNQTNGIFNILGDSSITGNGSMVNAGLIEKTAGNGTIQITPVFQSYGGTVNVKSGTLQVNGSSGGFITNANFIVNSGAELDLSVSNFTSEIEGVLAGSGGGTVLVNNGTLNSYDKATLNFPGNMLQLAGGILQGPMTNTGTMNIVGPITFFNSFDNNGQAIQSGAGSIGGSAVFNNDAQATYQIQNDDDIAFGTYNNFGLLEKTAGTGTNTLNGTFENSGTITASSGGLFFTGGQFEQNAGTLQLTPFMSFGPNRPFHLNGGIITGTGALGGTGNNNSVALAGGVLAPGNPFGVISIGGGSGVTMSSGSALSFTLGGSNQFSQLVVSNNAILGGTLNVTITNGYTPPVGTQFQIIAGSIFSTFGSLNVPNGISVTYSNTGIYLTVTGAVPAQLQSPKVLAGNFTFSFGTLSNQSYTVQANTNLATTNWTFFTNITGNGSLYQFLAPVSNIPVRFYRVSEP